MDSFISPFMQIHNCNHRPRQGGKIIMDNHTEVKLTLYYNCKTFVLLVSITLKSRFVTWIERGMVKVFNLGFTFVI